MGFESRVIDAVNRGAQTYANATIANRGQSHFLDPALTGVSRFIQRTGYPFPLLTPQMSSVLTFATTAGSNTATITGTKLLPWLLAGVRVSLELLETVTIQTFTVTQDQNITLIFTTNLFSAHAAGSRLRLFDFPIGLTSSSTVGDGGIANPPLEVTSPYLLAAGDIMTALGKAYTISQAIETGVVGPNRTYEVRVTDDAGLPALDGLESIRITARPAYQSRLLTLPQSRPEVLIAGPVAIDWVSGPMVEDYYPQPESQVYIEEFTQAGDLISGPRLIQKNDTLSRIPILKDQMLFWKVVDGGLNWNGVYTEIKAFESGIAHIWSPTRPPLDVAPTTRVVATVPAFSPYAVLLQPNLLPNSVTVVNELTGSLVPTSLYTVNNLTGAVAFDSSLASQQVVVTYRPRLAWQISVRPSEPGLELSIKLGEEALQVFPLGAAGIVQTITVQTTTAVDLSAIHIATRRTSGTSGSHTVEVGDWRPTGSGTAVVRYTYATGATVDYDHAASGLLLKPLWPHLGLLRARLDGTSALANYLDTGKLLV